jgi:aspartate racemase
MLESCLRTLLDTGVERIILGCTEIPLALDSLGSRPGHAGMDATSALARACIDWYQAQSNTRVVAA